MPQNSAASAPPRGSLTETDAAEVFGVTRQTLAKWRTRGCPHFLHGKRRRYYEAEVRQWKAANGGRARPRGDAPRPVARGKGKGKGPSLAERIRAATNYDDLQRLALDVAAQVAEGFLSAGNGNAATNAIREARQSLKAHAESDTSQADAALIPIQADAVQAVRLFESLISDKRRAKVLSYLRREAKADAKESPATDTAHGAGAA